MVLYEMGESSGIQQKQPSRYKTSTFNQFMWKGLPFEGPFSEELLDRVYNMQTRSDDVFLMTYARSGTTWMQNIIIGMIDGVPTLKSMGQKDIFFRFPILEVEFYGDGQTVAETMPCDRGRLLKTHLPVHHGPKEVPELKRKVVMVLRDPKDIAYSLFEYYQKEPSLRPFSTSDWNEFVDRFLTGSLMYGSWWLWTKNFLKYFEEEVRRCIENGEHCHIFLTFYEKLQSDFESEVERLAKFLMPSKLEKEDKTWLKELSDECKIGSMKSRYENKDGCIQGFIRQGGVGNYKAAFTKEQEKIFDKKTREELFPYKDILSCWPFMRADQDN